MGKMEYIRRVPGGEAAVLMLHGITGTPDHFTPMLDAVPQEVSVFNIYLEGHGGSALDFARSSMEQWRGQVAELLGELCAEYRRVYIVGHSMGTLLGMEAALNEPEKVRGLLLLNVPMKVHVKLQAVTLSLRLQLGLAEKDKSVELMGKDIGVERTWKLWHYIGWIPRFLELFALIRHCRTLVEQLDFPYICAIQSARDEVVSRKSVEYLRANPKIELHELPDSGHFGYEPGDLAIIKAKLRELLQEELGLTKV